MPVLGSKVKALLQRPYRAVNSTAQVWRSALFFGGFVFLFLILFQPFGLSALPQGLLQVAMGYGLTTSLIIFFLNLICLPLFPRFFEEEKWTVGKECIWNLLNIALIGLANGCYSIYLHMAPLEVRSLLIFEIYTLVVAVLPVTITVLLKESQLKNRYVAGSQQINNDLQSTGVPHSGETLPINSTFTLPSESANDDLIINTDDLIFIQAADNYVEVHYLEKKLLKKKLLRNSLKAISSVLQDQTQFFKTHKSYVVNLKKVNHVSGNAQGYKLHLSDTDVLVPVSRSLNEEIKRRLSR